MCNHSLRTSSVFLEHHATDLSGASTPVRLCLLSIQSFSCFLLRLLKFVKLSRVPFHVRSKDECVSTEIGLKQ